MASLSNGSPLELKHINALRHTSGFAKPLRVLFQNATALFLSLKPCFSSSFARPSVVVASILKKA